MLKIADLAENLIHNNSILCVIIVFRIKGEYFMKCNNCKADISEGAYFCMNCGKFQKKDEFSAADKIELHERSFKTLIANLELCRPIEISWSRTASEYVDKVRKLKIVLMDSAIKDRTKNLRKKADSFISRCKTPEFHIAFVGTIKAGKSTLINALLGCDLASTSVTPETAVLTKFRHSEDTNYLRINFYSKEEWNELWKSISSNADVFKQEYKSLNGDAEKDNWIGHKEIYTKVSDEGLTAEIEKWTSSKHVEHYFVKEVEVGLKSFNMPEQVVFVDTPGLDDAVKYRSDVTRNYIDRANAVFACIKADSLTGSELSTLYRIFSNTSYNPEKVYIIGTQWDSLNSPEDNWKKQKAEWIKYLSGKDCYGDAMVAERNITYAAAYLKNLCRNYAVLDENQKFSLMSTAMKFKIMPTDIEVNLEKLDEISNVDSVSRKISQDIVSKYSEYLESDIKQSYEDFKADAERFFSELRTSNQELIETSDKNIEEIKAKYEEAEKEVEEINKYKKQLTDMLALVRQDTERRVNVLCEQLNEMAKTDV